MNRRRLLGILGVGVLAKPSENRAAEPAEMDALAVRIVPTTYREKGGRAIELHSPSEHFHVVVTNVTGEPIRLWREWCSWGSLNLSFQVTDEAGRSVEMKKLDLAARTKDFPDMEIITPGGHHVREVTFDPTTWEGWPLPGANRRRAVRMRAIYGIRPEGAKEHGVWTGQISSPEES